MTQIFVEADGLQDCAEVIRRHVNAIGDDRVAIVIDGLPPPPQQRGMNNQFGPQFCHPSVGEENTSLVAFLP